MAEDTISELEVYAKVVWDGIKMLRVDFQDDSEDSDDDEDSDEDNDADSDEDSDEDDEDDEPVLISTAQYY